MSGGIVPGHRGEVGRLLHAGEEILHLDDPRPSSQQENHVTDPTPADPIKHAKKVIGEILIGRADGGLVEIVKACAVRTKEIGSAWQWRMTFDGDTWDLDTVTTGELLAAEKMLDGKLSYMELDPARMMWHRMVILIAHLHKVHGVPLADAIARAEGLTHQEQADMIDLYEVAAAPKDEPSPTS